MSAPDMVCPAALAGTSPLRCTAPVQTAGGKTLSPHIRLPCFPDGRRDLLPADMAGALRALPPLAARAARTLLAVAELSQYGTAQWNSLAGISGMYGKIIFNIKQCVKFSDGYRVNIGYIRVSSGGQRTDRQLDGIALDRVFTDKTSGKDMDRPEFQACLRSLQAGDMLHVHSIDRLTRSLQDLLLILENMADRHVTVKFYKENLTFSGESSPFQRLHLQIIGAVAEFERSLIRERQREGIALAKKRESIKEGKNACRRTRSPHWQREPCGTRKAS